MQRHYGGMAKHFDPYDFIIWLEVQILGIEPVISRTLEFSRGLNFEQLHEVLQAAIGWTDSHLHQFIVGGLVVGAPEYLEEDAYGRRVIEATDVHLRDLRFPYGPDAQIDILYQYDFGDNWQHRLILTEVPPEKGVKYPRCIAGSRSARRKMLPRTSAMRNFLRLGAILNGRSTRPTGAGRDASSISNALILRLQTAQSLEPCA